ncbi:hypothetical protein BDFG_08931 [Blastomyces dermatitidis ATCC 26199]|nr:hypothetical protein BDFG_08931 [Blastomyces dermatitidis ATCC 26199]
MDSDTRSYSPAVKFCLLFAYRYIRLVGNLIAFARYKPMRPPDHHPSFTANNITVIIPTLEGSGEQLVNTLESILKNAPHRIILSTIDENREKAEIIATSVQNHRSKVEVASVSRPKKSHQIAIAVERVHTDIVILADGDVLWPPCLVPWILAPFEDPCMGGVATCQRVQTPNNPRISFQYIWWFLGALYLERRNFDCTATTYMDGGVPCLSGRTVAYRTEILQSCMETFVNETWFGKSLNADDDNFLTRWMVTHGIKTYFQSHPDAEVLTTLEESSKFLKQCVRWSRSNWRSNLRSLFIDRAVWWRHPWSTYAVFLTTISQLALLTDTCLIWLCHTMTMSNPTLHTWWLGVLLIWMIFTKFIKLSGHYRRRPLDCLLFPVSALFGYVHCFIKMYALFSLHEDAWGNREAFSLPKPTTIAKGD